MESPSGDGRAFCHPGVTTPGFKSAAQLARREKRLFLQVVSVVSKRTYRQGVKPFAPSPWVGRTRQAPLRRRWRMAAGAVQTLSAPFCGRGLPPPPMGGRPLPPVGGRPLPPVGGRPLPRWGVDPSPGWGVDPSHTPFRRGFGTGISQVGFGRGAGGSEPRPNAHGRKTHRYWIFRTATRNYGTICGMVTDSERIAQ